MQNRELLALAEQTLDLAAGRLGRIGQAEVYAYETAATPVDFEANRLKALETKETRGFDLRVVKDGRIGLASTTRLDDLQQLVETAIELAAFGAEARFELPATVAAAPVDVFDPATEALPVEQLAARGQEMIDRVGPCGHMDLIGDFAYRLPATVISEMLGVPTDDQEQFRQWSDDILSFVSEFASRCGPAPDHRTLADAVIRKFEILKAVVPLAPGRLPVIFNPRGVAGHLLPCFGVALSGKSVLQGSSALSDRLGQQVFDPRLTIVDDSTISGMPGSAPFDDEGVPTRRLPLIARGTVASFYYDLQTAGLAGTQSTGNGYRSAGSLPSPSTGVIVVEPGDVPFEQLLAGIEEGLLVESMTGSAGNLYSGDFSGSVHLGYKIERGRLVGRVKDTAVAGNIYADMQRLGGISDTAEWVGGSVRAPHLLFAELGVSTRSG